MREIRTLRLRWRGQETDRWCALLVRVLRAVVTIIAIPGPNWAFTEWTALSFGPCPLICPPLPNTALSFPTFRFHAGRTSTLFVVPDELHLAAKIGEGGMGEVYRARDTKLDRDVALKVLPQAFTDDPDRLARFEREAKVLASLNHPNIGHIYGLEVIECPVPRGGRGCEDSSPIAL